MIRHYNMALVSESKHLPFESLAPVAAALSKQTARDLAYWWNVLGTVTPFTTKKSVPVGHYLILVQDNIDAPGAAGFHTDDNNQPYALIQYEADWSITASHEMMELLVDPWGNRLYPGVINGQRVQILEEVCDPPEGFSYAVDGVAVSEFVLPEFFSAAPMGKFNYSFLGNCTAPYQVPNGGYISYVDPTSGDWMQITNFGGLATTNLGPMSKLMADSGRKSLRGAIDAWSAKHHPAMGKVKPVYTATAPGVWAVRTSMVGPF